MPLTWACLVSRRIAKAKTSLANLLALVYKDRREAQVLLEEVLAASTEGWGPRHEDTLKTKGDLAQVLSLSDAAADRDRALVRARSLATCPCAGFGRGQG